MATFPNHDSRLEGIFPSLNQNNYQVTSPEDISYNCIAWAAEVNSQWWWPDPTMQYYWPDTVNRECSIDAFIKAYESVGYSVCSSGDPEDGYEKIAIYADTNKIPTHACRQIDTKNWTSKLGESYDIKHFIDGLNGNQYGTPKVFMSRKKQNS